MTDRLILASASPRRRQLLEAAGYAIEVVPSNVDEPEPEPGTPPEAYVTRLAWSKAVSVGRRFPGRLVLAADTVCAIDGQILNKPADRAGAEAMIRLQEGRASDVLTGLCLYRDRDSDGDGNSGEWVGAVERSVVWFRVLSDRERAAYLDTGHWQGKAGAYGIQDEEGGDDPFVRIITGSFSNVVGLPMERLERLLRDYPRLTEAG